MKRVLFVVFLSLIGSACFEAQGWAESRKPSVGQESPKETVATDKKTPGALDSHSGGTDAGEKTNLPGNSNGKGDGEPALDEKGKPYAEEAVKHYNRGVELHQSGFLNQAIAEYKAAIDADNRMEEAFSNLGLIYAAQRSYSKAMEAFNKALALKPGRPTTLNGLGTVLYARGRVEDAIARWKQAIASDPQFASAYYNMGNALENERDQAGALESYWKAIRLSPGMSDAYYRMGTILLKDKHVAQASILLAKAVTLSPDAEFVRDAKRQLNNLESQLAKEEKEEPEVQMNLMPPPNPIDESKKAPSGMNAASSSTTKDSVTKSQTKNTVNMFVQPNQSPVLNK